MVRAFLPRLPILRSLYPRVAAPLLPISRLTLTTTTTTTPRLKHLIKSYGWYALGVYFVFSVLDFGVAFIGINLLGAEYVSHVAGAVKTALANVLHSKPAEPGRDEMDGLNSTAASGQEGLYAIIVLAYTIHKTLFFPIRIGLTAAFTPRLVAWLSRKGWTGTSGTRRAAHEMRERIRERRRSRGSED
ncbi:hypothetical protein BDQ17DRAFT_1350329 [Cyathus striatus]|nr:hypothetical protein BDQ17DRAFT_1350329 [Cyathus striatus]